MTGSITEQQHELLTSWLGIYAVIQDHSWPLQDTTVLQVAGHDGRHYIVKASTTSHHIRREIAAHARGLSGLEGRVPTLRHAAPEAGILVTTYLPGKLVAGTDAETDPATYREAGAILAALHQSAGTSRGYVRALTVKTGFLIDTAQGLLPGETQSRLRDTLASVDLGPVELVTTHGDYQHRNWLQDAGHIKVIDFGRAEVRPWVHDLVRLSHQQFLSQPALRTAFHEGLGKMIVTEQDRQLWTLENLNQSVGTVVWAHQVGDASFEQQGVEMVERVLRGFPPCG
ncbi:aminoglycoside phosphotransferase family protein [Paenarthrobacter nitroguajacolicus]|uniref:Aminoglycoside phosphotransferase family protein n=1 Tax=Paenarthrobacter nitroguajacolicus TaxID=211146 RepID=A0A558HC11_PAENT|nr:aminoglycoside phosphotransferase family protein [Paenarthrobacter nitroguajacolicus]TVU66652.1 aminoglycoside phosphotransferase family protein [Paenarthrobacter nitroguajacolicus]